jgi:hypothetical protein
MTWDDAIKNMIKVYWETDEYENSKSFEKTTYNKKYFQDLEEEHFPKTQIKEIKGKK